MIHCDSLMRQNAVIAINYDQSILYFGNHNYLEIRETKNNRQNSCKIFESLRISLIKILFKVENQIKLSIVGEFSLAIVELSLYDFKIEMIHNFHYCDWILQTYGISDALMVLVSSRTNIILYDYKSNHLVQSDVLDSNRKILYSCDIASANSKDCITVATGNAFGVISIYKITCDDKIRAINLLYTYEIHSGPVFYVCISDKFDLIASSADDRSVSLWNLNKKCKIFQEYAHFARIWQVIFTHENNSLLSVSEDGMCINWNINGQIIKKYMSLSKRESLWRVVLSELNHAYISCQSGEIFKWNYQPEEILPSKFSIEEEKIQSLDMSLDGSIFFITVNGKLYLKKPHQNNYELILENRKYRNYAYMCLNEEKSLIFLGNLLGDIRIFDPALKTELEISPKMHQVKIVYARFVKNFQKNIFNLFSADYSGLIYNNEIYYDGETIKFIQKINLESKISSTVSTLDSFIEKDLFLCVVGYEDGSIVIYGGDYYNPIVLKYKPFLHHKKCCTYVKIERGNLFTCGKDGFINIFIYSEKSFKFKKAIQFSNLNWLAEIFLTKSGRLLVFGFYKQSKFCIFDPQDQIFLTKITCGGGYRQWRCQIEEENNALRYRIAFLERPHIYFYEGYLNSINTYQIEQPGMHSKEIRCQEIIYKNCENRYILIAMAGEEALIYLSLYDAKFNKFHNIFTINDHPSTIFEMKSLEITGTGKFKKFYLISVGARSSIYIYKIKFNSEFSEISDFQNSFCIKNVKSISSCFGPKKNKLENLDLRATALAIAPFKNTIYILIGFSDGVIRVYILNITGFDIFYYKSLEGQKGMPTSILYSFLDSKLITTFSNGKILTYDYEIKDILNTKKVKQNKELNYFEITPEDIFAGINFNSLMLETSIFSLCRIQNKNDDWDYKIAMGCYDGSICILDPSTNSLRKFSSCHSGAISAICSFGNKLITVSTDKKLKIWNINDLELLYEKFITVYDPCAISLCDFIDKQIVIISGIGTEILSVRETL